MPKTPVLKQKLYKKSDPDAFSIVEGILKKANKPLTDEERYRLKAEALAFKGTLLYQLFCTRIANEMQSEIVDNATTMEQVTYFRAVLADRRMLIQEIEGLTKMNVPIPKLDGKKT